MTVAIVGAAETTELGRIPGMSQIQLHADAALNTLADAGSQGQGHRRRGHGRRVAGRHRPLPGHRPALGGRQFRRRLFVHAARAPRGVAAIEAGYAETVLVTHGESGRSGVGRGGGGGGRGSLSAQFEGPYGSMGPTTMFTVGVLRYMKRYGMSHEQLATVAVVQREWAGMNPRASYRDPITVDDVLNSRMIAYPFHLLECCLVTDGGGALILTKAERARDFPAKPVYILGSGESVETPMVSQMKDLTSSQAFRIAGGEAMRSAGIGHADVDHMMVYDAFAHLPIWGLEDLGFCARGEAPDFIEDGNTRPGGTLPLNTNGGGLSYMHSGMYGMYALQESVRQKRGTAPAQVPGAEVSVCLGVGGMFAASGCIVMTNQMP